MKRLCVGVCVALAAASGRAAAQDAASLNGVWTLNRTASDVPREIGFDPSWLTAAGGGDQSAAPAGGRGRRGSSGGGSRGGGGAFGMPQENYDEAQRVRLLTAEARTPPTRLMIVDTAAAITFTNDAGQSRTVHPTGREESIDLQGVPVPVTTTREPDRLVVVYHVERGRDVRYAYSRSANPPQLVVELQFLERGAGDKARLVYERGTESAAPARTDVPQPPLGQPSAARATGGQTPPQFDERPGAELKGITSMGILVEDLGREATACGLNRNALEDALSKRLAAAGFNVRRNSDEDTYVYVNVITNALPNGTCVSRYDAFLYTHATANLSYRDRPVLVQVSLMHRGGIGASAPAAHAAAVTRGLEGYVDIFATQIRDANK